jgi:hypothetical protein
MVVETHGGTYGSLKAQQLKKYYRVRFVFLFNVCLLK